MFYQLLMWFGPVNEMIELVSGMQHHNSGMNHREYEDQSWFKVQVVPVFRFDRCKMSSRTL
jgi:hypothetical protein